MQSLSQLCHWSMIAATDTHKQRAQLCSTRMEPAGHRLPPWGKSYLTTSFLRQGEEAGHTHPHLSRTKQYVAQG